MNEAELKFFKERGSRKTTDEVAISSNNGDYEIDPGDLDDMEYAGHIMLIDPDYLEWLEEKVETLFKIVDAIKPELENN